jgi:three-Cys-motif partner protein
MLRHWNEDYAMTKETTGLEDGLPVAEAGEWAAEKHRLLADYIVATRYVRGKVKRGQAIPAYIDLFSGPGRACITKTGEIIDGSPLVAWKAAAGRENPFTSVLVSDIHRGYAEAAETRLKRLTAPVQARRCSAVEAAKWAADQIDPNSYHLAFVDPYNLGGLPWEVFKVLLPHKHLDFIVHFSEGDLTRNLDTYSAKEQSSLDSFAPGWREKVGDMRDPVQTRGLFFEHWIGLFEAEGYQLAKAIKFTNSKNATLYRLILLSREASLATKIWKSVAKDRQTGWDF